MPGHGSALERVFGIADADLPPDLARYLLSLAFPPQDHARYEELSRKAQDGGLTASKDAKLDDLLTANDVLTILRSKAGCISVVVCVCLLYKFKGPNISGIDPETGHLSRLFHPPGRRRAFFLSKDGTGGYRT